MTASQRPPNQERRARRVNESKKDIWTALSVLIGAASIIATIIIAYRGWQRTAEDQMKLEEKTATDQIKLEQKKASIQFVNDQIHYLYGPLYSYMLTSTHSWLSFSSQYNSEIPLQGWVLWMKTVFMPLNDSMAKTILENAHLIDSGEMPDEFTQFLLHVETYRPVISSWESGDFAKTRSAINYPVAINKYICETFIRLKHRQAELLGLSDDKTGLVNCDDLGKVVPVRITQTSSE